jgi:RNA polymerase sigma-70 factor (ECF subfamily)
MTTFLYPAVKHISTTIQKKKRRFSPDNEDLNQLTTSNPEKPTDQKRSELASALGILPDEQREIVLMRFVDDMRLAEIANALDIPLSTVKSRLYHALDILRNDKRTQNYFLE